MQVATAVVQCSPVTVRELCDVTGFSRELMRFAVANLKEHGFVEQDGMLLEPILDVPSLSELGMCVE